MHPQASDFYAENVLFGLSRFSFSPLCSVYANYANPCRGRKFRAVRNVSDGPLHIIKTETINQTEDLQ